MFCWSSQFIIKNWGNANYVTKVSQLENDLKYQTQEQVEKYIHDLVDGADDALYTLKELAEALNNDPK